jgi:hypothetical protein
MSNPLLPGQISAGNINLRYRPSVPNPEGGESTVFSESAGQRGAEVLYPRVVNGKLLTSEEAWKHYLSTGAPGIPKPPSGAGGPQPGGPPGPGASTPKPPGPIPQ